MGRNGAAWGDGRERDTEYVEEGEWIDGRMGEGEVDGLRRRRGPARLRKRRGAGNGWVSLIPLGSRVGSDKRRYQQWGGVIVILFKHTIHGQHNTRHDTKQCKP